VRRSGGSAAGAVLVVGSGSGHGPCGGSCCSGASRTRPDPGNDEAHCTLLRSDLGRARSSPTGSRPPALFSDQIQPAACIGDWIQVAASISSGSSIWPGLLRARTSPLLLRRNARGLAPSSGVAVCGLTVALAAHNFGGGSGPAAAPSSRSVGAVAGWTTRQRIRQRCPRKNGGSPGGAYGAQ
jgi:hypothetical protein